VDSQQVVADWRDSQQGIIDLKYSPDGQLLAVASSDQTIEVYSVAGGKKPYRRLACCSGM
jgi:WD40 repeat protein